VVFASCENLARRLSGPQAKDHGCAMSRHLAVEPLLIYDKTNRSVKGITDDHGTIKQGESYAYANEGKDATRAI
jgi:hypothetical protein